MKKKIIILFIISFFIIFPAFRLENISYADGEPIENYVVYDENGNIICEKSSIEVGDGFITSEFYEYEIIKVDNHKGYAKLVKVHSPPQISYNENIKKEKMSQRGQLEKKICLYMTHNDESYTPSDGYDSVYGKGGIHDVAYNFKQELGKKGINVVLDETLHIPHNSSAYTRSSVTANRLLSEERPDAMFDVHRDGVSKSYYYVTNDGKEYSKIRIVVGKSNPNFDENYAFAQSIFALGNSKYPFLFSDIYLGKGHYNQALQPTDLLFEMGTYLIEKELVYNSLPLLADTIDTLMYASEVSDEGDITVDESSKPNNTEVVTPSNNDLAILPSKEVIDSTQKTKGYLAPLILSLIIALVLAIGGYILYIKSKNKGETK